MSHPTSWNLRLLYKSDSDPQIEKDMRAIEKAYVTFTKKYKNKDFASTAQKLKRALDDARELDRLLNGWKLLRYFNLRKDTDTQNTSVQAKLTSYEQRVTSARNNATFFPLEIGKTPPKKQKEFLNSSVLKEYKHLLEIHFNEAKYFLSEKEEQLANLLCQPGLSMWVNSQEKYLSSQLVPFHKGNISVAEAKERIDQLPIKERRTLHDSLNHVFKSISHFAEAEINAIYNFKKLMDNRRGYKKPYSATILGYENDDETIEKMVVAITKSFPISHRFYKLHAKFIGQKKLSLADRSVKVGKVKRKFDFASSLELIKKAFTEVDPKYAQIVQEFAQKGQFDVYPRQGKVGGAYCSGGGKNPTFVLLNHTDSIKSAGTLAHEMGHAFHTEFSKSQPPHYQSYTISVAEVASTFFEQVANDTLEKGLNKNEQIIFLHNKILGDVASIFRQVAFFNFELEIHERIKKEGQVSKEEIAKIMNKHLKSYLGPVFEITEEDGYFFVYLSHMRRFFYVYSYAYGQLISRALFEKWKEDPSYAKRIEQFLRAGGSMSPKDIFKSIGIDTTNPKFFETGLKAIEKDIEKLEKLTKK